MKLKIQDMLCHAGKKNIYLLFFCFVFLNIGLSNPHVNVLEQDALPLISPDSQAHWYMNVYEQLVSSVTNQSVTNTSTRTLAVFMWINIIL